MATVARSRVSKLGEVERVYRILHDWLVAAKIRPGEFLSEAELAVKCGTSRTPVREACTRLMQDKWLSRIRRKGFLVTPISVRDIVDMYQFRKVIECFTVEKVAQTASSEQFSELRGLVAAENDPAAELTDILRANQSFHRRLAELAGNQRVLNQVSLTLAFVARLDTLCTQTVPGWIGHSDILRTIEARQPADARRAMEVHLDDSRDKMIKLFAA
ncbi:MAG TPA: GntR family transcriptional regulator [Terriglobales bacterium]|nr:GntR family transcriptional regulator [Terriglobales bacterium]